MSGFVPPCRKHVPRNPDGHSFAADACVTCGHQWVCHHGGEALWCEGRGADPHEPGACFPDKPKPPWRNPDPLKWLPAEFRT